VRFEMSRDLEELAKAGNRLDLCRHLFAPSEKTTVHRTDFDVLLIYLPQRMGSMF